MKNIKMHFGIQKETTSKKEAVLLLVMLFL